MEPVAKSMICGPSTLAAYQFAANFPDTTLVPKSEQAKALGSASAAATRFDEGCGAAAQAAAAGGMMADLSDPSKMIDKLIGGSPSMMEQLEK